MAAFRVVTAPRFDIAIMVVILLNVISISSSTTTNQRGSSGV